MRPIRAQKTDPYMGHECVKAAVQVETWLAMRKAPFLCAFAVRRFSVARASVMTLLRHAGCGPG